MAWQRADKSKNIRFGLFWSGGGWEKLMSIKYELIIYWSDEDQSFVVEVPELPGCMADGETYEQAVATRAFSGATA